MESSVCTACAKARRRCGKQQPHCLRCRTRGISCQYPPKKPTSFVALVDDPPKTANSIPTVLELLPPLSSCPFGGAQVGSWWFARPETWIIETAPKSMQIAGRFTSVDLDRLLKKIVCWLAEWIEKGSNQFIHHELYRHRLPRSIQDAYMSLSAYLCKTTSTEHMIFRIIEDRVTHLVAEGIPSTDSSQRGLFDALEYLARVQALLVYQCIGLYDGNIRLRHLAEQHIPLLEFWLADLILKISQNPDCGHSLSTPPPTCQLSQMFPPASHIPTEDVLWHNYIIAESVRRTWLVTAGFQGVYKLLHSGHATCMGGTFFTTRSGFWEAKSAMAWEKRCCEVYAGLLQLTHVDQMFASIPKDEICDFAKVVLECLYGPDQLERWGVGV